MWKSNYVEGWDPDKECVVRLSRVYYSLEAVNKVASLARISSARPETVNVRTKTYRARKGKEHLFA